MSDVPIRPQAREAAVAAYKRSCRLSTEDPESVEKAIQAFLAAEEIREVTQRISWSQFGGEPVPCKSLRGPWRRIEDAASVSKGEARDGV